MKEPYIVLSSETALAPAMQRIKNLERIAWQVNEFSQSVLVAGTTAKPLHSSHLKYYST